MSFPVALLAEGVDRNKTSAAVMNVTAQVALLAEGVDRNFGGIEVALSNISVALLAEGVDRNIARCSRSIVAPRSPSSRRAWIEIAPRAAVARGYAVALLAEGVDRNMSAMPLWYAVLLSPSSRRAWIEICRPCLFGTLCYCRPPRGGRG